LPRPTQLPNQLSCCACDGGPLLAASRYRRYWPALARIASDRTRDRQRRDWPASALLQATRPHRADHRSLDPGASIRLPWLGAAVEFVPSSDGRLAIGAALASR